MLKIIPLAIFFKLEYETRCLFVRFNSASLFESEDTSTLSQDTQLEALSDHSGSSGVKTCCQRLLFEAYRSIGEPDAVYGVGTGYSSDAITRVKAYEYEGEFSKALRRLSSVII